MANHLLDLMLDQVTPDSGRDIDLVNWAWVAAQVAGRGERREGEESFFLSLLENRDYYRK